MSLSWSRSAKRTGEAEETMVRRFVEASRRAEIVTLVNAAHSATELADVVSDELCEALEAESAFVLAARSGWAPPEIVGSHGVAPELRSRLLHDPSCVGALGADDALALEGDELLGVGIRRLALSPFASEAGNRCVVGVGRWYDQAFDAAEIALLRAVTAPVGHALERTWLELDRQRQATRQAALVRAAKRLNQSLELGAVLNALGGEVAAAFAADAVAVYFGDRRSGLEAVATHGLPEDFLGFARAPGEGLAGRVIVTGRPQRSNAYMEDGHRPAASRALDSIRCGLSVPLHRHGHVDGALSIGFNAQRWIADDDVELLVGFAELASVACRNAARHAEARRDATIDSLTGCLNHAAMQTRVREEISRSERVGTPFSIAMLDVNDFKSVNERHGHLTGDTVLRAIADALQGAVRLHDQVARYGGDEFVLLLPNADSVRVPAIIERVQIALSEMPAPEGWVPGAAIGVASWEAGESAAGLLERADARALAAKRRTEGKAVGAQQRVPKRGRRRDPGQHHDGERQDDRPRSERLMTAAVIGAKLSRLLEPYAIARTIAEDLHRSFGYERCAIVRLDATGSHEIAVAGADPFSARPRRVPARGVISQCLHERRAVLDTGRADRSAGAGSELAVPLYSGASLWGAMHVCSSTGTPFDAEEARLVQVIADQISSALRIADLYQELESSYIGTAEALAAALEAKDYYTADHARSIADLAVAVGTQLGLDQEALRDLRYGAIFHDIGKIAVPDAILNKPAKLSEEEFEIVQRHPITGEQILASVPFLANVRRIVRHDHERWDGTGYPDGLSGPTIPIGARIVFAVDAYHAMVSDRPYRSALPIDSAIEELRAHAGTQFDPTVVTVLIDIIKPPTQSG
jgi:diguanylate cyclase (GGDEF)-like protein